MIEISLALGLILPALVLGLVLGRLRWLDAALPRLFRQLPSPADMLAGVPISILVTDATAPDYPIVFVNDCFVDMTDHPASELLGRNARLLQGDDRNQPARDGIRTALAQGHAHTARLRNYRKDGTLIWLEVRLAPFRDRNGRITHYIGVQTDVTADVAAEQRLREHQCQQYELAQLAQLSVQTHDLDEILDAALKMLGRVLDVPLTGVIEHITEADAFQLRAGTGWQAGIVGRTTVAPPEDSPEVLAFRTRQTVIVDDIGNDERFGPQQLYRRHAIDSSILAVIWTDAEPWGLLGVLAPSRNRFDQMDAEFLQSTAALVGHAITRARHARQLAEHGAFLDAIVRDNADAIVTIDSHGTIVSANPAVGPMLGHDPKDLLGKSVAVLMSEADARHHDRYIERFLAGGPASVIGVGREVRARHKSGDLVTVDLSVSETVVEGRRLFVGTLRDLSQRHAMRQQLIQAQKMEAIGQLTGGVAHDFNNLLTVILSNLTSLVEQAATDQQRELLGETLDAAQRGSTLTHQLLAFARQQPLMPRKLDVNALVTDLERLLVRTLGESYVLTADLPAGLWPCNLDAGQLEAALLNLAVNARDAMPEGGNIHFSTANVVLDAESCAHDEDLIPGRYVVLAVSDNGSGMSPEVVANAFEPFFTTKPFGQGSGLGLSMVFGFVKQTGGHVKLTSTLGSGTEVRLFLPAAATKTVAAGTPSPTAGVTEAATEFAQPSRPSTTAAQPTATRILMVEDDPLVSASTRRMLERLGFEPTLAGNAREAIAHLESGAEFDLLFTDVVMPGDMNGRELAEVAHALKPDMAVLFTSGYTNQTIFSDGELSSGITFLQKPYTRATLADTINKALARDASSE